MWSQTVKRVFFFCLSWFLPLYLTHMQCPREMFHKTTSVDPACLTQCAWKAAPVPDCVIICCFHESDTNYRKVCAQIEWNLSCAFMYAYPALRGRKVESLNSISWLRCLLYLNIGRTNTRKLLPSRRTQVIPPLVEGKDLEACLLKATGSPPSYIRECKNNSTRACEKKLT